MEKVLKSPSSNIKARTPIQVGHLTFYAAPEGAAEGDRDKLFG